MNKHEKCNKDTCKCMLHHRNQWSGTVSLMPTASKPNCTCHMNNLSIDEVAEVVRPRRVTATTTYKPRKYVEPPKRLVSKQFQLGFMWATAIYGVIALAVIIYTL